jgi:hypothetical protein
MPPPWRPLFSSAASIHCIIRPHLHHAVFAGGWVSLLMPSSALCCCLQGRYVHEATKRIPVIGDGDTG